MSSAMCAVYYEAVRDRQSTAEGPSAGVVPAISVSDKKPAWLGDRWRVALTLVSLLAAAAGLLRLRRAFDVARDGTEVSDLFVGLAGGFAIAALLIAYLSVAGFGEASFSIGTADARTRLTHRRRKSRIDRARCWGSAMPLEDTEWDLVRSLLVEDLVGTEEYLLLSHRGARKPWAIRVGRVCLVPA